jgi:hypothetical protein
MKNITTKKCIVCGEMFIKNHNHSQKTWAVAKFCSKKCWSHRGKEITKVCEWCKKEFSLPAHIMAVGRERERKTCSTKCRYNLITGNRSYMWQGEKAKYNLRFRDALSNTYLYRHWRNEIKKRDGKCVNCGENKPRMHVHHIYPLASIIRDEKWVYERWTDLYKSPNSKLWDIDNGVTICEDCHYSLISYALQQKGYIPK